MCVLFNFAVEIDKLITLYLYTNTKRGIVDFFGILDIEST